MNRPYVNVLGRAKRIHQDIEKLLNRIDELEKACNKLRSDRETFEAREAARERVLKSIENNSHINP